ncbi:hypothetical protein E2C01_060965 [Portunus trituberculatus]|uniref:Uncharacterized protein n=1 Tax=Portunus trituberculatus TaxID=210409 RepID=A0A5B7H6V9_PORTR|nr:hypothetical protein [Portunus trituberculatus]
MRTHRAIFQLDNGCQVRIYRISTLPDDSLHAKKGDVEKRLAQSAAGRLGRGDSGSGGGDGCGVMWRRVESQQYD